MNLGKNVKHLRALAGVALEPMAEAMGLERAAGRQKIYALEKRESRKSEIASKLADFFGLPVSDLLSEDLTTLTPQEYEKRRQVFVGFSRDDMEAGKVEAFRYALGVATDKLQESVQDVGRTVESQAAWIDANEEPSACVKRLIKVAIEAENAGVPSGVIESLTEHLATLRDAQKANMTANREIEAPANNAQSPSDREVEDTLRDLGIGREREASGNERTGTHVGKRKGR